MAFFTSKVNFQTNIGLDQVITFDRVGLNLGDGFHPVHSIFTAPRSGVYLFSSSIMTSYTNPSEVRAAITVNGIEIAKIFGHGDSGRHDQGAQTVIVNLKVNDEVDVRNINLDHEAVYGNLYSSFSGILLYDM